jgi:predicted ArsR family transcriptional regulator
VAVAIKRFGSASTADLATELDLSYETVRSHVSTLADLGLVDAARDRPTGAGRPASRWRLTRDGEHLFPKHYGRLALSLLELIAGTGDDDALDQALRHLVDEKVAGWTPLLVGLDPEARLEALTAIYDRDDPHISVEHDERGPMLVERNCPFLDVAMEHPQLCRLTVDTLSRLLDRPVVREARFQAGDGRCVFRPLSGPVVEPVAGPVADRPASGVGR